MASTGAKAKNGVTKIRKAALGSGKGVLINPLGKHGPFCNYGSMG